MRKVGADRPMEEGYFMEEVLLLAFGCSGRTGYREVFWERVCLAACYWTCANTTGCDLVCGPALSSPAYIVSTDMHGCNAQVRVSVSYYHLPLLLSVPRSTI